MGRLKNGIAIASYLSDGDISAVMADTNNGHFDIVIEKF